MVAAYPLGPIVHSRPLVSGVVQVLYLGAASGTSVSHVSDIVGPEGTVFAVEFSHRSGEGLIAFLISLLVVVPSCKADVRPSSLKQDRTDLMSVPSANCALVLRS